LWASVPTLGAILVFIATCTGEAPPPTETVARAVTSLEDPSRQAPGSLVYVASAASDHASDYVSAARLDPGHFVTATTTNASNGHHTQVSVWGITDTTVSLTTSAEDAAYVTEVAVARLSDGLIVTAMRTQVGTIRIATWTWDGTTLALAATQSSGLGSQLSLVAVSQPGALSATSYQIAVGYIDSDVVPAMNVYKITPSGAVSLQGGGKLGGTGSALSLAAPGRPFGSLVTAHRSLSGALQVTPWTIDEATGARTKGTAFSGVTIQDVKLAPVGYRRVAAEIATSTGTTVATFETSGAGSTQTIQQKSSLGWGTDTGPMAIVNDGGAGFATFVNKGGSGTLRTWDAVDTIGRLDFTEVTKVATNGTPVTLTRLVPDRLVASYVGSDNHIRVVLYRNYDMPLVRAEWPLSRGDKIDKPKDPTDSFTTFGNFFTNLGATDLTVAAGRGFVGYLDIRHFTFTDRSGAPLEPAKWSNIPMTNVTLNGVFKPVIDALNKRLEFQEGCDPELGLVVTATNACQSEDGDGRMLWDDVSQRFVILSSYSSAGSRSSDPQWKGQHYMAFAVSQSADPRDGFYLYASTESKIVDWPRIGVGGGMFMYGGDDSLGKGFNDVTAALHVFDMATLANPVAAVTGDSSGNTTVIYKRIPVTKVPSSDTYIGADKDVFHPLVQYGPQPKMAFLFRWPGSRTLYFKGVPYPFGAPVPGGTSPTVAPARVTTTASTTMSRNLGLANQPVYLTFSSATSGALAFSGRVSSGLSKQNDIQIMKVPFTVAAGALTVPAAPLEYNFVCPGRSAEPITCESPASAVGLDGKLTMSCMRFSIAVPPVLLKQSYYVVLDANMAPVKQAALQIGLTDASSPTIDFSTVVPDPADDRSAWVAQHAANSNGGVTLASGRVRH
jgi:hypothetical protein